MQQTHDIMWHVLINIFLPKNSLLLGKNLVFLAYFCVKRVWQFWKFSWYKCEPLDYCRVRRLFVNVPTQIYILRYRICQLVPFPLSLPIIFLFNLRSMLFRLPLIRVHSIYLKNHPIVEGSRGKIPVLLNFRTEDVPCPLCPYQFFSFLTFTFHFLNFLWSL